MISVAALSFKPGPGMAAIVTRSLRDGFWPAFCLSMGCTTIEMFYFLVAVFSFSIIDQIIGQIEIVLKIIGSSYLIYLGVKGLRNYKKQLEVKANGKPSRKTLIESYMSGMAVTMGNPLVILFYAGVVPVIMDLSDLNFYAVLVSLLIIFGVHFVLLTMQCLLAAQFRQFLTAPKAVQVVNIVMSSVMIAIGLYIAASLIV